MSVTGPDFVALQVRDLDRSARFYTERLGLHRTAVVDVGDDPYPVLQVQAPCLRRHVNRREP